MAVEWRLAGSRYAILLLALSLAAVVAALWRLQPQHQWQALVLIAAVLFYLRDWVQLLRPAVTAMSYRDGQWFLALSGGTQPARFEGAHFLSQRFGVIRFRTGTAGLHSVVLLPDSLSGEGFRRLAIALRQAGSAAPG